MHQISRSVVDRKWTPHKKKTIVLWEKRATATQPLNAFKFNMALPNADRCEGYMRQTLRVNTNRCGRRAFTHFCNNIHTPTHLVHRQFFFQGTVSNFYFDGDKRRYSNANRETQRRYLWSPNHSIHAWQSGLLTPIPENKQVTDYHVPYSL